MRIGRSDGLGPELQVDKFVWWLVSWMAASNKIISFGKGGPRVIIIGLYMDDANVWSNEDED